MAEIAQLTYNHRDFVEIMEMIDKRLNDHGKNWRHVFKALTLLDYLLHSGSEAVISYARENAHVITTLKEFIYIDDDGKDQGANVRQKSKDIAALLADEARLRDARRTRHEMRGRFGVTDTVTTVGIEARRDDGQIYNEDRELQRALEESRRTAEQEQQSRKAMTQEEIDIQKAIELSEKEQIERLKKERDQAVSGAGPSQGDNLIDIFGSLDESPQPLQQQGAGGFDPFAGFGNVDPFQQQQMQQQMLMQQQQQLQAQLQQQQMMQMQLAGQGNPFGMGMQNTGGMGMQATGGMGQQQQQQPMQNQLTGDMNAMARGT
ncbi:hypothetical protein BC832DRAFT_563553 [Gaertneriomyces semiglobifer]|nr:hypothetical protein BC832DRAFT_563553 [Gaertneriomyces semiglobifer]